MVWILRNDESSACKSELGLCKTHVTTPYERQKHGSDTGWLTQEAADIPWDGSTALPSDKQKRVSPAPSLGIVFASSLLNANPLATVWLSGAR